MIVKKKLVIPKLYMAGCLLVFLFFLAFGRQVYTHITVNYTEDPAGDVFVTVYDKGQALKECEVQEGRAELYFWGKDMTEIAPIHYDAYKEIYLKNIVIHVHGKQVLNAGSEEILDWFTVNDGVREVKETDHGLYLTTKNDDPRLLMTEELQEKIHSTANFMSILNLLFFLILYTILYWYFFQVLDLIHHHSYGDLLDALLGIIGITAMLLSWNIAFSSVYAGTVHPDEMQTRAAVEYYRTHWIQPDVRSPFVAETVSGYGMTRLSEINLYYLFAGKFANLCAFEMSFRALGMLLILILVCFVLKNIKKERFMAILFFATPQLWYLFSYATSDAYDYLFAVFAIYEVLAENSGLNRILKNPFKKRHIWSYLLTGFVFANLLMAKKTFYVVLVTIFLFLLYRLIFAEKNRRKELFLKYLSILGISFAIVLVRYAPDFGYYGLQKEAAVDQVIEETAWQEYKPSTPATEQAKSTLLYEKGVTLGEFFTEWQFNQELFRNYFGHYGIYSLRAKDWYYVLMGALYITLFAVVGVFVHQKMNEEKKMGRSIVCKRLVYWTMWGMILLMYLLTVYNAYFVDFQPQGRYLFPALPALACQIGLYREVGESKTVRTLTALISLLSLYSFYKIAFLNF